MKISTFLFITGTVLFGTFGSFSAFSDSETSHDLIKLRKYVQDNKKSLKDTELLFIQQAKSGYLLRNPSKKGCYTITLGTLSDNILYFSDQPQRITGKISIPQFISMWKHDSKVYHFKPNVVIQAVAVNKNGFSDVNDVSVLSAPQYHPNMHSLTYTACSLKKDTIIAGPILKDVTLFFDPFHRWPP